MLIMKTLKSISRMWIWTVLLVFPGVASGLRLLNISGPSVVVNGSTPLLLLDCEYELSERDKYDLVVKWYFNREPFPSYQWVPNNLPQYLGILKGRVDPDYHISDDPFMKHRALAIRNPTVELTGEYTCWISSFENEAMARKKVIIYSPPTELTLTWTKPTDISVLVLCKATGVYPEPHITIYRSDDTSRRIVLEGADVQLSQDETGYSVSVQLELYDYELEKETVFECVLKIPGTEYQVQDQILYYPAPDYDYDSDVEVPHYLDEHQYIYNLHQSHQDGAPTTTTTTTTSKSITTSTIAAFVAAKDDKKHVIDVKGYSKEKYLAEHRSNNNVNKKNGINIDSASKVESVTAEENPQVAQSGEAPTTMTTSAIRSTTSTSTSTTSVFVAEKDDQINLKNKNDKYTSNDIVIKENDANINSANKAESVTAEEVPRVAESVSGGESNSRSHILLCSIVLLLNILQ